MTDLRKVCCHLIKPQPCLTCSSVELSIWLHLTRSDYVQWQTPDGFWFINPHVNYLSATSLHILYLILYISETISDKRLRQNIVNQKVHHTANVVLKLIVLCSSEMNSNSISVLLNMTCSSDSEAYIWDGSHRSSGQIICSRVHILFTSNLAITYSTSGRQDHTF